MDTDNINIALLKSRCTWLSLEITLLLYHKYTFGSGTRAWAGFSIKTSMNSRD